VARLIVVEDESHLATGIKFNLELEGHEVTVVDDGLEAVDRLAHAEAEAAFDLVILDVMLPGLDGFAVASRMRKAGNFTPVLMLTAKSLPEDMVNGIEAGADDYLTKPFALAVLLARVKGLLRRREWARGAPDSPRELVRIGEAEVDFAGFELVRAGETVRLTLLEAMLLKLLWENRGRVVTKAEILEKVWHMSGDTETRAVDNFILRLRKLVEAKPRDPVHILTIRGAGYRLEASPGP
jgi:two-component system, OmpR family, alkaline phosphatase synthesis response regulator PhoP